MCLARATVPGLAAMQPRDTFLLILGLVPAVAFTLGRFVGPHDPSAFGLGIALLLVILTMLGALILVVRYPEQPGQALPRWVQIGYLALGVLVCLGALLVR